MNRCVRCIMSCMVLFAMSGCWDRLELEKQSISLTYAFDLDQDGHIIAYQLSPIFNKTASKTYEVYRKTAVTSRQAKEMFNSSSNLVTTGKVQVFMFSEKILKSEGAMPYLDVWYRDPKDAGNMRMVAVKGSIESILNSEFKDKPMLPEYLSNILEVNKQYNRTTLTTFQDFHRQSFDKGITPAISEIMKGDKDLVVTGSVLLTKRGMYTMSLNRQESALLLMLQNKATTPIALTLRMPSMPFKIEDTRTNVKGADFVTINVVKMDRVIETQYTNNRFQFHVKMKLNVSLAERTFNMSMEKSEGELTAILVDQLGSELHRLIQKVQKQELDPFGFGDYARAYQYRQWKSVENNWPVEFSKATVTVSPTVKILDHGIIE